MKHAGSSGAVGDEHAVPWADLRMARAALKAGELGSGLYEKHDTATRDDMN